MNKLTCILIAALVIAGPAYADDKDSSLEDRIRNEYGNDDHKGKGRPDNPGEHGRDNAAQKQRENPGNGSKGGDSWEDSIRDKYDDKDKDKDKDKKHKQKNKNK